MVWRRFYFWGCLSRGVQVRSSVVNLLVIISTFGIAPFDEHGPVTVAETIRRDREV
jgi:hypothetical protein